MKKNIFFCQTVLWAYIALFLSSSYYLCTRVQNIWLIFNKDPLQDPLFQILINDIHTFGDFLNAFKISNVIFNTLLLLTKNPLLATNMTPPLIVTLCLLLIYKITYIKTSNSYIGLFAVFIFATMPFSIHNLKTMNVHLSQIIYVLITVYCYLKSHDFINPLYSLLYCLILIYSLSCKQSIAFYNSIIIGISTYYLYCNKTLFSKASLYNISITAIMIYTYMQTNVSSYCASKLPAWLFTDNLNIKLFLNIFSNFFTHLRVELSDIYLTIIVTIFLIYFLFFRHYESYIRKNIIISALVYLPLLVHLATSIPPSDNMPTAFLIEPTLLTDFMPFFAFLSIETALLLFIIYKETDILIKKQLRSARNILYAKIAFTLSAIIIILYFFLIGISKMPVYTPAFLTTIYTTLKIPYVVYDVETTLETDWKMSNLQEYLSFLIKNFPQKTKLIITDVLTYKEIIEFLTISYEKSNIWVLEGTETPDILQRNTKPYIYLYIPMPNKSTSKILNVIKAHKKQLQLRKKFSIGENPKMKADIYY